MRVKAVLWTYKPRRDGSCNIKIYVQGGGEKHYRKTDFHTTPDNWDKDKGRLIATDPLSKKTNAQLERLKQIISMELNGLNTSLLSFIDSHIVECEAGLHDIAVNTVRQYKSHLKRLRGFSVIDRTTPSSSI